MDSAAIPVAAFEEDTEESFIGPTGLTDFFNEEDEEDYYEDDGEGYREPEPLETSTSQRVPHDESTQVGNVSVHTHSCQNDQGRV